MLSVAFKRIGVEESAAVKAYTAYHTVVECTFQHIHILGITVQQEQTVVCIDIGNGSACLAVAVHIGQVIVLSKALTAACGADASGQVHLFAHHILPDAVYGSHV